LTALRNIIRDIDVQLYERYANDNTSKYLYLIRTPKALKEERELVERKWDFLAEKALANNPNFKVPNVPYKDSHIVGKHNGLDNGAILFID
jgi:serine/threonine-protein phosphatase 2A regulatory subunit B'